MKKLLLTALLGTFAVAQETAAPAPSKHQLFYALDTDYRLDGDVWENEHFVSYTYKISDLYKLKPAVSFFTNGTKNSNDDWEMGATHQFARVELFGPTFAEIVGFKTSWLLRYNLPTGRTAQLAGSYGSISPRLKMEREFGSKFNLTVIPKITFHLQRNGSPVTVGPQVKETRNDLIRVGLEIAPQFVLAEGLTLTYDLDFGGTWVGEGSNGEDNFQMNGDLAHELELMYTIKSLGGLGVGAIAIDEFDFGNHLGAEFFKEKETFVGLRIQKAFDL